MQRKQNEIESLYKSIDAVTIFEKQLVLDFQQTDINLAMRNLMHIPKAHTSLQPPPPPPKTASTNIPTPPPESSSRNDYLNSLFHNS